MSDWENSSELYSEQWYKNFIKINIISLIELLVSGYFFGIDEIIDLSLYGIAVFFINKMNRNECVVKSGNRSLYSVFYQIIVQTWRS